MKWKSVLEFNMLQTYYLEDQDYANSQSKKGFYRKPKEKFLR